MLDRLEKPFLTVETGEAYQPIRLTYHIHDSQALVNQLNQLTCLEKNTAHQWTWYWKAECNQLHFESVKSFRRDTKNPLRLGSFLLKDQKLYLNLSSFKRACLAVSFFHETINPALIAIEVADFINKVTGIDERVPHGLTELFKEEELENILLQREKDYKKIKQQCENAKTPEEAFTILSDYTLAETKKRLPYAERYHFNLKKDKDPEMTFLAFYIFLRSRELVAIRRWFGETQYTLADVADETVEQVFGELGIDLIE